MRPNSVWQIGWLLSGLVTLFACAPLSTYFENLGDCAHMVRQDDIRRVASTRGERFLGKVPVSTAECLGGERAVRYRTGPWLDWPNYYAAGDATSLAPAYLLQSMRLLGPNAHGINGALYELEVQRIELIKFNLFDNNGTYQDYVTGRTGVPGAVLREWSSLQLPKGDSRIGIDSETGKPVCVGESIRYRTTTGICNDIFNPLMGSTGQLFARNVQFETTFPELGRTDRTRNRHDGRIGLLKPDPQVISRKLFTRRQSHPESCNQGVGDGTDAADCDYKKASTFNVLAGFWIQFMTHDWFSHLSEGRNGSSWMTVGCRTQLVDNVEQSLTADDIQRLGCRPDDQIDEAIVKDKSEPPAFTHRGATYLARAPKTMPNHVTAWWDASQIYGFDDESVRRVKHDPCDGAKLWLKESDESEACGIQHGYLPILDERTLTNPQWKGQESTAFPDNWSIGLSFYHNVFAREHNAFVDAFRNHPDDADTGLRDPANPDKKIVYRRYKDVKDPAASRELFEIARLVVSAEIAKIHTIEWTTQLLYNEPLYRGMNANWSGLLQGRFVRIQSLERGDAPPGRCRGSGENQQPVRCSGGRARYHRTGQSCAMVSGRLRVSRITSCEWRCKSFRLALQFSRRVRHRLPAASVDARYDRIPGVEPGPRRFKTKVPVVETVGGKATDAMRRKGLGNWAISLGRQPLGALTLENHPQFLQNLKIDRLQSDGHRIDVAALDLIRDRSTGRSKVQRISAAVRIETTDQFQRFHR